MMDQKIFNACNRFSFSAPLAKEILVGKSREAVAGVQQKG